MQATTTIKPEAIQYNGLCRKRLWMTLNPVALFDVRGQFQYVKYRIVNRTNDKRLTDNPLIIHTVSAPLAFHS
jgi:hypothetical protein